MYGVEVSPEISADLLRTGPTLLNRIALYAIAISPVGASFLLPRRSFLLRYWEKC